MNPRTFLAAIVISLFMTSSYAYGFGGDTDRVKIFGLDLTGFAVLFETRPEISYFGANPPVIEEGQTSTLVWRTKNARKVEIIPVGTMPPYKVVSGAQRVRPEETTTYTIIASNSVSSVSKTVKVAVNEWQP